MRMNVARVKDSNNEMVSKLLRVNGTLSNQDVVVLIDSGADHNIIRPGLVRNKIKETEVSPERFDGTTTPVRKVFRCQETIKFDNKVAKNNNKLHNKQHKQEINKTKDVETMAQEVNPMEMMMHMLQEQRNMIQQQMQMQQDMISAIRPAPRDSNNPRGLRA
ncbi:retroelement pol polyprotein [Plasmopara halstedii]|uniref:Retroelement pol polyprotein n=1 Tax=Plasmopara halstedii TaxID=4781 RepID=A0A0P1AE01_PLAHL|nr:retroelement pol polyprotein [Plasmopara halstedii]CEG38774.1 retroelement pol polyprotein [Plasmopara halstedii]|eukprot:XP_024575143.1 retroelement pol polyprotein [Plasmopara halstedii]